MLSCLIQITEDVAAVFSNWLEVISALPIGQGTRSPVHIPTAARVLPSMLSSTETMEKNLEGS